MKEISPPPHTYKRLDGELSHLRLLMTTMGHEVYGQLKQALTAFKTGNHELAREVKSRDDKVDQLEVETDREILDLLARNSPFGSDLREALTVLKSVGELEKIGDEATRIASLVLLENNVEQLGALNTEQIREIEKVAGMVLSHYESAFGLFENWDEHQAQQIIEGYRLMNGLFELGLTRTVAHMKAGHLSVDQGILLALLSRSLERIAHHSVNLAEYGIYEVTGIDLRHKEYLI